MRLPLLLIVAGGLLTGCASLLDDMQSLNASLSRVNSALRTNSGGTSGVHVVNATVESTCNQAAFEEAFKRQYNIDWNDMIGQKEDYYRLSVEQNPNDTAAKHNYALYRGRKLKGMKFITSEYGINSDDHCIVQSYFQGQHAGSQAAARDFGELESQEI